MPTPTWFGLNLFRLVAVSFMAWAFVAQFLSLADELNRQKGKTNDLSSTPTISIASGAPIPAVTKWDVAGSMIVGGSLGTPAMAAGSSTLSSIVTSAPVPSTLPTPNLIVPTPRTDTSTKAVQPVVGLVGGSISRRRWGGGTANEAGDPVDIHGGFEDVASAIQVGVVQRETRADLVVWMVLSRLIIGTILIVGISAQLGVPEMFLYNHASWLGPQSTPLWLGGLQILCSVEVLRVNTEDVNLIPGYALLGIGLLNMMIAFALFFFGRNLAKTPPPPLYFNHAQRLLFWKPEPKFYATIHSADLPTHLEAKLSAEVPERRTRKGRLPRSNAHGVGLDLTDSDESDEKSADVGEARYINGARAMTAEEDVTKGGYPTFAPGSHIGQPGRHVPAGTLEQDRWGGPVRFTQEEEGAVQAVKRITFRVTPNRHRRDSAFDDIQADLIGSPRPPHTLPRPNKAKTSKASAKQRKRAEARQMETELYRAPSGASDNSAYSGISRPKSTYRQSIDQAAKDLGPHFPLPPLRTASGGDGTGADPPITQSGKLEIRGKDGRRPPSAYIARAPLSSTRPDLPASLKESDETSNTDTATSASARKPPLPPIAPLTPITLPSAPSAVQIHQPQPALLGCSADYLVDRQLSASPDQLGMDGEAETFSSTPEVNKARDRSISITPSPPSDHPLPPSSIKRASSADVSRPSRGVRFDLSSVEEEADPESPAPTRPSLRIPGTTLRLALPAILSPTARRRRFSYDSANKSLAGGLKASPTLPAFLAGEVEANRHSIAVLGGGYLAGGREPRRSP